MARRVGAGTIRLERASAIAAVAAVGSRLEQEGPLGAEFDRTVEDSSFGEKSWEKAETKMQQLAMELALQKGQTAPGQVDVVLGGDLLNQCIASAYAVRELERPFLGLYGACSTMAESLTLAALLVESGAAEKALAVTSSHFCSSERQFRFPLNYGGVRTPTAQHTATASGAALVGKQGSIHIEEVCIGRVVDLGVTDLNNMGAAMAPAAYDTLRAYFADTHTGPADYDAIFTGDLGELGHEIVMDLFRQDGVDMTRNYEDCGMLLYDRDRQDMHAGGSGCGCSAAVFNGYLLTGLKQGRWRRILFAPTGALLSPTSSFQGESIPGICHLVCVSTER